MVLELLRKKLPYLALAKENCCFFNLRQRFDGVHRYGGVNYEIDGKKVVVILAGTRENFYDELKRIAKQYKA